MKGEVDRLAASEVILDQVILEFEGRFVGWMFELILGGKWLVDVTIWVLIRSGSRVRNFLQTTGVLGKLLSGILM